MVIARKYIIVKHFDGEPKETDLKLVEEELPPIEDGGKYFIISSCRLFFLIKTKNKIFLEINFINYN